MHSVSNRRIDIMTASLTVGLFLLSSAAHAQGQASGAPTGTESQAVSTGTTASRRITVAQALKEIGAAAGIVVLPDSNVADRRIASLTEPTTAQNAEAQIARVAEAAGRTVTWAKLYLPAGEYTGDDVVAYAMAQARLFGGTVGSAPAGSVEIMGKAIPAEKAKAYVDELKLKPVYVVSSPYRTTAQKSVENQWAGMNEEQRNKYAKDQAARLATADAATRQAFMQEHMAVMAQLMRSLTPEQRTEMLGGNGNVRVFVSGDGTRAVQQVQVIESKP